jgi:hypothetical protein
MRIALLAVLLVTLTGCGVSAPTAEPSPTPTAGVPTSEPTSTTDPAEFASTLRIRVSGVSAIDGAGAVIFEHPWTEDGDALVSDLTDLLGSAPTTSLEESSNFHSAPLDVYSWDGISVAVSQYQHDNNGEEGVWHFDPIVRLTAAMHENVRMEAINGISVGAVVDDSLDTLAFHQDSDEFGDHYYIDPNSGEHEQFRSVQIYADGDRTAVTMIIAPCAAGTGAFGDIDAVDVTP